MLVCLLETTLVQMMVVSLETCSEIQLADVMVGSMENWLVVMWANYEVVLWDSLLVVQLDYQMAV